MASGKKHADMYLPDTNQDPKLRTRTQPMEVLNLGFPRTGTTSLQQALDILGIPCWHGWNLFSNVQEAKMWSAALDAKYFGKGEKFQVKEWDQLLGNFGAACDVPVVCFSEELMEAYPDAKVILVEREIESWHKSFENVISGAWNPVVAFLARFDGKFLGPIKDMTHRWINGYMGAYSQQEMREKARETYINHYKLVRRITPKERLLEYDIASGWEPLCTFLQKPIPDVPFPRANDTMALRERIAIAIKRSQGNVLGKAVWVAIPCLCVGLTWYLFRASNEPNVLLATRMIK